MSLRYLVPSLGILACTAGAASAADVGGLTINGYVDTVLEISSMDDDIAVARFQDKNNTLATTINGDDPSGMAIDWKAAAQLEVGYAIGDVNANMEIYFADNGDVELQQAYVNYKVAEQVAIKMGRMHNLLGWEGKDSPELYRVNTSILGELGVLGLANIDGVRVGFKGPEGKVQVSGGLTLADGIYEVDTAKDNDEFAIAGDVTVKVEDLGKFTAVLAYDQGAGYDVDAGETDDVLGIDIQATIDMLKKDNGLLFGAELNYTTTGAQGLDNIDIMALMVMANYKLPVDLPASLTAMITYITADFDNADESASEMEIAVALLTNPTKEDNFAVNLEFRYISRDYEDVGGSDELNEFGVFLEALAVIP